MNEHLQISEQLALVLEKIENMPSFLAELPMDAHPKFPQYKRFLRVEDMDNKSKNNYIHFNYKQIFREEGNDNEFELNLPSPEWVVYAETWSYMRGDNGNPLEVPLKENYEGAVPTENEEAITKVRVPSYKYMLWLMKYKNAQFLELVKGYASDFIRLNIDKLNEV